MSDERLNALGHLIWRRVMTLESLGLARQHGSPNLSASTKAMIRDEENALWADLQTLFRGGVFPEDMEPFEVPED